MTNVSSRLWSNRNIRLTRWSLFWQIQKCSKTNIVKWSEYCTIPPTSSAAKVFVCIFRCNNGWLNHCEMKWILHYTTNIQCWLKHCEMKWILHYPTNIQCWIKHCEMKWILHYTTNMIQCWLKHCEMKWILHYTTNIQCWLKHCEMKRILHYTTNIQCCKSFRVYFQVQQWLIKSTSLGAANWSHLNSPERWWWKKGNISFCFPLDLFILLLGLLFSAVFANVQIRLFKCLCYYVLSLGEFILIMLASNYLSFISNS